MKLVSIAPVVLLLATASAWAEEEPKGFAEIPWGTPRAQVVQPCTGPFPPTTFPSRTSIVEMSCWRSIEINGKAWNPRLLFVDGNLAAYQIGCGNHCYTELKRITVEKFGPPQRTEVAQYRMNNGTMIDGEISAWEWPSGVRATLRQRDRTIDYAVLFVSTPIYAEAAAKIQQERTDKAKKAF